MKSKFLSLISATAIAIRAARTVYQGTPHTDIPLKNQQKYIFLPDT